MLEIKDGTLSMGGRRLFDGLSFVARDGRLTVVTGRRGSGKTSLLKSFLGMQPLDAGYVSMNGEPILPPSARLFRRDMAYVPQDCRMCADSFGSMFESVARLAVNADIAHARKKLFYEWKRLALDVAMYDQPLSEVGEGALRRMMLSVAGVMGKRHVLLDEPMAGQLATGTAVVQTYLRSLAESGRTVLLTMDMGTDSGWCDCEVRLDGWKIITDR